VQEAKAAWGLNHPKETSRRRWSEASQPKYGIVETDMDEEQIERSITFILDQQAKFAAGLEGFRYEVKAQIDRVVAIQETQAGMITNLGLHLGQLAAKVDKLSDKVDQLADMQRHTDGRLNIVISQVDDLIRRLGPPQ
jgi:X-X-X-Leu-X-X-Gly heptad repeat protein